MFRRRQPYFYAFDLLVLDGRDLRSLPLLERKRRLREIMPAADCRLLFLDYIAERGRDLFRLACERDIEGIVAKWAHGSYQSDGRATSWLKVKNAHYSQMVGRRELFDARRGISSPRRLPAIRPELRLA
jgi:ATP-dependent DNA ligase